MATTKKTARKKPTEKKGLRIQLKKKKSVKPKKNTSARSEQAAAVDESVRECHVSSKLAAKWKGLSTSTVAYLSGIVETNMLLSLSSVKAKHYSEVQRELNILKGRMKEGLLNIGAPASVCKDYKTSVQLAKTLSDALEKDSDQLTSITAEITSQEKSIEDLEKEIEAAQRGQDREMMHDLDVSLLNDTTSSTATRGHTPSYHKFKGTRRQTDNTDLLQLLACLNESEHD